MTKLTVPELAMVGNLLFTQQRTLRDVSAPFSISDFIEGLELALDSIEERIDSISEEQLQFRIPGQPEGPDWNHDQHHFNTSELVTHLTNSLKSMQGLLRREGLPVPEPVSMLPPTGSVTGMNGQHGLGHGGRGDLSLDQTLLELRSTRDHLLGALRQVPVEQWRREYQTASGPGKLEHLVMFMGMHAASHSFQLMEMQSHEAYPSG